MILRADDVFCPGAFPEYINISGKSAVSNLSYEFRLMQAIRAPILRKIQISGNWSQQRPDLPMKHNLRQKKIAETSDKYTKFLPNCPAE